MRFSWNEVRDLDTHQRYIWGRVVFILKSLIGLRAGSGGRVKGSVRLIMDAVNMFTKSIEVEKG